MPSRRPSAFAKRANRTLSSRISGESSVTHTQQTDAITAAGSVRRSAIRSFARSTCAPETGMDCKIQRFFPSSDTELGVKSVMPSIPPMASARNTGREDASSGICASTSRITSRLITSTTAAASKNKTPRPELSRYVGLAPSRRSSRCRSAVSALAVLSAFSS